MALCLGNALVLLAILLAAEAAPAEKEYGPSCGYGTVQEALSASNQYSIHITNVSKR